MWFIAIPFLQKNPRNIIFRGFYISNYFLLELFLLFLTTFFAPDFFSPSLSILRCDFGILSDLFLHSVSLPGRTAFTITPNIAAHASPPNESLPITSGEALNASPDTRIIAATMTFL